MRALLILAAFVIFSFLAGRFYVITGDDGTYIALAQALQQGSYRAINVPGEPVQVQYPPLFPMLLLPFAHAPLGLIRLWVSLIAFAAVVPVIRMAKIRDPQAGAFAALLFVTSPLFGEYATTILTECAFIGLSYAILARVARTESFDPLVPVGLIAAWLMKSAAAALVAATLLHYLAHRKFKPAFFCAVILGIGMAPWWAWQIAHESNYVQSHILVADIYDPSSGHLAPIELLTQRVPYNVSRYVGRVVADVMAVPYFRGIAPWTSLFFLKVFASVFLTGVMIFGGAKKIRREGFGIEEKYVIIALALFSVHPVFSDRYLFILLPSLAGYLLLAFSRPRTRALVGICLGTVSIVGCILSIESPLPREEVAYFQAVDWIKEHTPADAVIAARKPTAVWYHAGRTSSGDVSAADYVIRDDYTIGIHSARKYLDPVLADSSTFAPVFVSGILPDVKVYKRR